MKPSGAAINTPGPFACISARPDTIPKLSEDLQKGLPQLHFLRQAYKDPLNKSDGSWRFIYVNAAGQIIGSTKYTSLQQMALYDSGALQNGLPGQIPGLVGTPVSSLTNSSGFGDVNGNALSNSSNSAQTPSLAPTDPNAPPQPPGQAPGQAPDQSGQNLRAGSLLRHLPDSRAL